MVQGGGQQQPDMGASLAMMSMLSSLAAGTGPLPSLASGLPYSSAPLRANLRERNHGLEGMLPECSLCCMIVA
jgi:hypothetical protein